MKSSAVRRRWAIVPVVYIVSCLMPGWAGAVPIVDGRFDPAEGYTSGSWVKLSLWDGKGTVVSADDGMLWTYRDSDNGDLYVNFVQPVTLIDNTYGDNSVGWVKNVAPSGKHHNFDDLLESDQAQFTILDGDDNVLLDFVFDYISRDKDRPSGYGSLGAAGRDGEIIVGDESYLLAWGTSLDYNFNDLGYVLTHDSPATDSDYTENPEYPGWLFEVSYEFKIGGGLFSQADFGEVEIPIVHHSPNKIANGKINTSIDGEVPEPATIVLLGLASLVAAQGRRAKMC